MCKNKIFKIVLATFFFCEVNASEMDDLYQIANASILSTYDKINSNWTYVTPGELPSYPKDSFNVKIVETTRGFSPALI